MSRLIKIKAQDFMKSFKEEWNTDPSIRKNFSYEYMKKPKCSRLMLKPGGFINRVMERLQLIEPNLRYKQECYTVDALYVGGKDL